MPNSPYDNDRIIITYYWVTIFFMVTRRHMDTTIVTRCLILFMSVIAVLATVIMEIALLSCGHPDIDKKLTAAARHLQYMKMKWKRR